MLLHNELQSTFSMAFQVSGPIALHAGIYFSSNSALLFDLIARYVAWRLLST